MALPTACSVCNPKHYKQVQGTGSKAVTGNTTIITAPGAGKYIRVQRIVVSISKSLDTSIITLRDGTANEIWRLESEANNDLNGHYQLDFGESGLQLTANSALTLYVATANSTAMVTAVGYVT